MITLSRWKRYPKSVLAVVGLSVIVVLSAFERGDQPMNYHSQSEILQFHFMLGGDLPDGTNNMFIGSGKCAGCHGIDPIGIANVLSTGENVSPAENWRATMMANSSKDPFWRAKVAHEVSINPGHEQAIVSTCTSCHAPLGKFEAVHNGVDFTMSMLDTDSLANDGVSCMGCHSQQVETLGNVFSGELTYNKDTIWGPVFDINEGDVPLFSSAMVSFVGVEPIPHPKMMKSEACAGCHTLRTHTADLAGNHTGNSFIEQATYHEWLNSSYNSENSVQNKECQNCHMPETSEPIVVASGYSFLAEAPRQPYRQHWFVGGNSFMLNLMKNRIPQLGITATEDHFNTTINRTLSLLQNETAYVELMEGVVDMDTARYTVRLTNLAGHKFPSGYPSRRAYIEFKVTTDDGDVLFHSGKLMPDYEVQGQNETWEPHYNVISDDLNEVQIYEMVMVDVNGNETTILERADHPIKDNRLVPLGFTTNHPAYDTVHIAGVPTSDTDFNFLNNVEGSGTDDIRYHIPLHGYTGNIQVTARLMYQSVPPKWVASLFATDHPTINAFEQMYWEEGPAPVEIAHDEIQSIIQHVDSPVAYYRISPNPTVDGRIVIDAGNDKILQAVVYSTAGQRLSTHNVNKSSVSITLPETPGTYLVDVITSGGRKVSKVLRR